MSSNNSLDVIKIKQTVISHAPLLQLYELPRDTRTVCENDTLPMLYTSEYNGLFVRFMSEINGLGPGFNLSYSFIPWENMWTSKFN